MLLKEAAVVSASLIATLAYLSFSSSIFAVDFKFEQVTSLLEQAVLTLK